MDTVTESSATIESLSTADEAEFTPSPSDLDWWAHQAVCPTPSAPSGNLTLPEWIAAQAADYRALGSKAGDWLAGRLEELAREVRYTAAMTPADHDDRIEALEASRRRDARNGLLVIEGIANYLTNFGEAHAAASIRRAVADVWPLVR